VQCPPKNAKSKRIAILLINIWVQPTIFEEGKKSALAIDNLRHFAHPSLSGNCNLQQLREFEPKPGSILSKSAEKTVKSIPSAIFKAFIGPKIIGT
jgi:hypothetical protein